MLSLDSRVFHISSFSYFSFARTCHQFVFPPIYVLFYYFNRARDVIYHQVKMKNTLISLHPRNIFFFLSHAFTAVSVLLRGEVNEASILQLLGCVINFLVALTVLFIFSILVY